MQKLRLTDIEWLDQGHTAKRCVRLEVKFRLVSGVWALNVNGEHSTDIYIC